eukprot:SAG31_NODE_20421_length_575_cov_0.754202_1_plen_81_part_00
MQINSHYLSVKRTQLFQQFNTAVVGLGLWGLQANGTTNKIGSTSFTSKLCGAQQWALGVSMKSHVELIDSSVRVDITWIS